MLGLGLVELSLFDSSFAHLGFLDPSCLNYLGVSLSSSSFRFSIILGRLVLLALSFSSRILGSLSAPRAFKLESCWGLLGLLGL